MTRSGLGRRDVLKLALAGVAGSAVGLPAEEPGRPGRAGTRPGAAVPVFPPGFLWGTATAAYQVEGAAGEDGRGPSIWDTFSHTPGRIRGGDTGDVADDHYHRYPEDFGIMKGLGVRAYRFSIAWPRVLPEGTGAVNPKGLAFYDRLVDALLAEGIRPWPTLFHWDLPQALEDRWGGWRSEDTAKAFAEYAAVVARALSDRVGDWFTVNELSCFTDGGYLDGWSAPGLHLPVREAMQVRHHAALAHGLGVQALRAHSQRKARVGFAANPDLCVPVLETPEGIEASRRAMRERNAPWLTAILEGRYPDAYLEALGKNAPVFTEAAMKAIGSPLDFVGLNLYAPTWVAAAPGKPGYRVLEDPPSYPRMASDWLKVGPQIAYWGPRHLFDLWGMPTVISENGASAADPMVDGRIDDTDRVMYLKNHLLNAGRAVQEGYPLQGYFLWSLLDNFEWTEGFHKRFGIVHVDFATQKRTPKLSAEYYRQVVAARRAL